MPTNIVSNLDTKSYLLLLRELKKYYDEQIPDSDFYIREIRYDCNNDNYVVTIHYNHIVNTNMRFRLLSLPENQLILILRKVKLNKLNERK